MSNSALLERKPFLVVNEHSSNLDQINPDRIINDLKIDNQNIIYTNVDWRVNRDQIAERVTPDDLLVIVSGDGGINDITHALCDKESDDWMRTVPQLFAGGGHGNDAPRAFNSRRHRKHLNQVLLDGRVMEFAPLKLEVENLGKIATNWALSYVGVNLTALLAEKFEGTDYRDNDRYKSATKLGKAVIDAQAFVPTFKSSEELDIVTSDSRVYEFCVTRGSAMAQFLTPPSKYSEHEMFKFDVKKKSSLRVGAAILALLAPSRAIRPIGNFTDQPITLKVGDDVPWQRDGKKDTLEAGSELTITLATDKQLRVVTTRIWP
jgi:hypothetical protein